MYNNVLSHVEHLQHSNTTKFLSRYLPSSSYNAILVPPTPNNIPFGAISVCRYAVVELSVEAPKESLAMCVQILGHVSYLGIRFS